MVTKCVGSEHGIHISPFFVTWLQNALTGNKLRGACSAFGHMAAKYVTKERHCVTFLTHLVTSNKMCWDNEIGAYKAPICS